jgi:acyl-CoA reductase-like NAD-dependent aldehyde dehydrogenase
MNSDREIGGVRPRDLSAMPPVATTPVAAVAAAVSAARAAQPAWEAMGFAARAEAMTKAAKAILERADEVAQLVEDEGGKIRPFALMTEVNGPLEFLKGWIKVAKPYLKSRKMPFNPLAMPGKSGRTDLIARGVVGVIAPWNYPLGVYFKPVTPALLCGNAVVLKPSEYAPRTGAWFTAIMNEFLPKGVVQCVQGGRDVGQALVDGGIDSLIFTGSVGGGKAVVKQAAAHMLPVSIELGGKDAAIILDDCNLDRTVAGVLGVGLLNSGQDCGAIERVYVQEGFADRFVEKLGAMAAQLKAPGPQDDASTAGISPVCNAAQLKLIEDHVADALAKGAKLVTGGKATGRGLWFQATILDRCDHTMKVVMEETFGPVLAIIRVKDVEEAVRLANATSYGLNASIWTSDLARGQQLALRMECGSVFINNHGFTGAVPFAPWTGVKDTGYGVANSEFAMHTFVRPRSVIVDKSTVPDFWWPPADKVLQEIGERLVKVQLGSLGLALGLPGRMKRRQKMLMDMVRGNKA